MLHGKWENVRVDEFLMGKIKRFAKSHEYKSLSQLTELALEDYIKKIDAQNLGQMITMLRDDYSDNISDYAKQGIENFDEYMRFVLLNKNEVKRRKQYDKIMNDKIDEIKKYVESVKNKK